MCSQHAPPCAQIGRLRVKLHDALQQKGIDLIADSTSGGTNMVPYFFDKDIVEFPLLHGELFPFVTLKEMTTSNSVHAASLGNVVAQWSASEGSAAQITLETTDGLIAQILAAVFDVAMAITIGRDFLSDTPVNVGAEIEKLMGLRLTAELDKVIAIGDGVTQPQGLINAAGTVSVTATNSTAGPYVVKDLENMVKSLPKQYRSKEPSVCWVGNDASWFRIRGIPVSSTDQRRIFGYDVENYMLYDRPFRVENDLVSSNLFFLKLGLYRMYRRLGLQIETSP